jgi:hypothetical protein
MTRRAFLCVLAGMLIAPLAEAQAPGQHHRVGFLNAAASGGQAEAVLRETLRSLGYVEGANLVIDAKAAHGIVDRLPALTRELLEARSDRDLRHDGGPGGEGRHDDDSDCDGIRGRSCWDSARRQPRQAGRQRHRNEPGNGRVIWQAARASQGDHSKADPPHYFGRHRTRGRGTRN